MGFLYDSNVREKGVGFVGFDDDVEMGVISETRRIAVIEYMRIAFIMYYYNFLSFKLFGFVHIFR